MLKGDIEDPLAGSVRLSGEGGRIVDVVVGRYGWQKEIIQLSEMTSIGEVSVKVARPSDRVPDPRESPCRRFAIRTGEASR